MTDDAVQVPPRRRALHLVAADGESPAKSKALSSTERSRRHRARQRAKGGESSVAAPLPSPATAPATGCATAMTMPATLGAARATTRTGTDVVAYAAERAAVSERLSRPVSRADRAINPLRVAGALVLAVVAIGIAWVGVRVNMVYGSTLGRTSEAAGLFAWLSIGADILALLLPSAACALWADGRRGLACTAWSVWSVTCAMALLASVGFVSLNISDTTASRARVVDQGVGLGQRVERMRQDRAAIAELRASAAIEAEIQRLQSRVPADTWKDTKHCADVTLPDSARACDALLRLRQALATAQRRDLLDAELAEAEGKLSTLPPITVGDPQATTASRLLVWASAGLLKVSADDIAMARVAGMVLLPQLAGIVLMVALAIRGAPAAAQ